MPPARTNQPTTPARHPPNFDVVAWTRNLAVHEGESKSVWYGHSKSAGLLREFPELDSFISRYYRLETEIEDFLVYRPLNAGGSRDDQP